jgi:maleylacetoacetate isomerase
VRIALALKGCDYENVAIDLAWEGGDHEQPAYRAINPQANVPLLVDDSVQIM